MQTIHAFGVPYSQPPWEGDLNVPDFQAQTGGPEPLRVSLRLPQPGAEIKESILYPKNTIPNKGEGNAAVQQDRWTEDSLETGWGWRGALWTPT